MLINVARELCIGAAPCVAVAGNVFQLDEEGIAVVVGPSTDDTNTRLAAEACPVRAIFLYDDNKKQLFPPVEDGARAYIEEKPANDNANPTPTVPATKPANDDANPIPTIPTAKPDHDNAKPANDHPTPTDLPKAA